MFPGIDRSEILRCLELKDPVHTGSVRHVLNYGMENERTTLICGLVPTDVWLRHMRSSGPRRRSGGIMRITWAPGSNILFRLEFPRDKLMTYEHNGLRYARVMAEHVKLYVQEGPIVKQMTLGPTPEVIDFGEYLDIVPHDLYEAAASYVEPEATAKVSII